MSEFTNVAEIFGSNVFNDAVMQERLPKKVYKELKKTIENVCFNNVNEFFGFNVKV